ncbi:MAG: MBL fold metallo-hydrolase [Spirochaetes bacterium]|nr:MBL fold metallo-hydrolase [Spirochaetota bacterium]
MRIEFVGAARTVTGSSYILKNDDFTIMIDCGMFQGKRELKERNYLGLIYAPEQIDALLVTHAHIDHSGLIPKLVKKGFNNRIFATKATCDLLEIMLPDSAHIQEMDSEWVSRRNKKLGREPVEPLYTIEDAQASISHLAPQNYGEIFEVVPGVKARFRDAGHILGSAFIEVWVTEKGKETKIVFSGDLGPDDQAIIKNAEVLDDADILLIESTYGDRLHKSKTDTYAEFEKIINDAYNKQGNIIIPSFAVERTQEIIYTLGFLFREGKIPKIPVYIDSPLAISATEIFRKNPDCFDEATKTMLSRGESPLNFPNLTYTRSTQESKDLNKKAKGAIIISASGMCTAGRIKFHLQNNLFKPESSVIFVGYQAEGTLGRQLVEGEKRVRVYGEDVAVNAAIHTLGGFSGHADKNKLLSWIKTIQNPALKVFVVHGEEKASLNLSEEIKNLYGYETYVPGWGDIYDLETFEKDHADHYGVIDTDKVSHVEGDIEEVKDLLDDFIEKYRKLKEKGSVPLIKNLTNDVEDLKEMIKMISKRF